MLTCALGGSDLIIPEHIHPLSAEHYSTKNLAQTTLRVLSAYGSEDGVMNRESYEKNWSKLPADTTEVVLDGGCHAQFGSYGAQEGDGIPTISGEEQVRQTAEAIAAFVGQ